jgi:hypothetical protein
MIRNYCEGPKSLLCARRNFSSRTGRTAPTDMTPIGILPNNLLLQILRMEMNGNFGRVATETEQTGAPLA